MRVLTSRYRKDFPDTQVGIVKTGSAESILSKVAISRTVHQRQSVVSECRDELTTDERTRKGAEVTRYRIEHQSSVRVEVRPVTATAVTVRVNACKHREGLTRLTCDYTGEFPAAKDLTTNAMLEEVGSESRHFINEVGDETMFAVEG